MDTSEAKINDDVFAYEGSGGMSQCISGFGRNAIDVVHEAFEEAKTEDEMADAMGRIEWHINELVRWCRHFNGELKRMKASVKP